MIQRKTLELIAAVIATLFLFISMNPFIMWIVWPVIINVSVLLCLIFATIILVRLGSFSVTYNKIFFSFFIFLFMLHIGTPLLGGSGWEIGKILSFSGLLCILFFEDRLLYKVFELLRKLMKFFCWFSLIIFCIMLVGIELPYYKIPAFTLVMQNSYGGEAYYKLFGFVVSSTNTVYDLGGISIARICGPFQEPGHFAIYLGLVMFFEKLIHKKNSWIFIVTIILTFSPNSLLFLAFLFMYDLFYSKTKIKFLGYLFFGCLLGVFVLMSQEDFREEITYLIVGRNFEEIGIDVVELLDNRAGKLALYHYENFSKTSEVWYGKGVRDLEQFGVLSDYRGMIFKFGLMGLILSILASIRIISFSTRRIDSVFIMIIISMIYLQRSWMFESTSIYLLLIIGLISFQVKQKNIK